MRVEHLERVGEVERHELDLLARQQQLDHVLHHLDGVAQAWEHEALAKPDASVDAASAQVVNEANLDGAVRLALHDDADARRHERPHEELELAL
eukprot:14758337-Heterocapsa_arctica.AAC.1